MAKNPRFNNSDMFTNIKSDDYSEITPDSKSEVLATQGNVINSIKVFWNNLKAKLAYAVTRPNTNDAVGGNYQPVYVNNSGDVIPCSPSVFQTAVNNSTINLPEAFPIYAGQTVCFNVTNGSGDNNGDLKIGNISVYYPTGATVKGSDVIGGSYLFTYISGNGDKWILNNKINVVSGNNDGLMTVAEHNKLADIAEHANAYSLPIAGSNLGGVKSAATGNTAGRDYNVQINSDGTMKVNVPWTDTQEANWSADLKVGQPNTNVDDATAGNQPTYIKVVENGQVHGRVQVVGKNGVTISSTGNGELEITGPQLTGLTADSLTGTFLVFAPDMGQHTTEYFLAGNGTWQKGTGERRIEYDPTSSVHLQNNAVCGNVRVKTSDGNSINFYLVKSSGAYVTSSNNVLALTEADSINIDRAYPIFTKVNNVRPGFIVFTTGTGGIITGTIY